MSVEWFIARRYLTARRRQAFISLISAVSIAGVGVGVAALIIALALMTGAQGELRDRILGSTAHVYVYGPFPDLDAAVKRVTIDGVAGAAPAILGPVLMVANHQVGFASLKGVDPTHEPSVTEIEAALERTSPGVSLEDLQNRRPDAKDAIMLGEELARTLGVSRGDDVLVVTAELTSALYGLVPRQRRFEVVGIFKLGFYELDNSLGLISMPTAMDLLQRDAPDYLQLRLTDPDRAGEIRERLTRELGIPYRVEDWTQVNKELYSALWLEKVAISLAIGLIVMVAALNIVASLVLLVMEKTRDIGILRTMGATSGVIRRIFIIQGVTIGLIGTTAGTVLGLAVCFVMDRWKLIKMPDVYQITYLPFRVETMDVLTVVVIAMVICLLATIYPSRLASRIDPAEALRNQ
ncbi:MAG TPA: ABC transporter permease [Vicinamibacterales bacterium]|nr:ABC transporter permease [Vicinamibacterales bacterium]